MKNVERTIFSMIISCGALASLPGSIAYAQGSVTLTNISYPYTAIESGNWVKVQITGAAPNGEVTSTQNGGPSYDWNQQTDGMGNWSITAQESDATVGAYLEHWYVAGTEASPISNYTYIGTDTGLPSFSVYAKSSPATPGQLTQANACGGPTNVTAAWGWTPLSVYLGSTFAYSSADVTAAYSAWTSAQSKIAFQVSSSWEDIYLADNSSLPVTVLGGTSQYTQACDSGCYNQINTCTTSCLDSTAMYYVNIALNSQAINNAAGATGYSSDTFAIDALKHELGHALSLADVYSNHGGCSEAGTVMNQAFAFLCDADNPTSLDLGTFNTTYPTAPYYCTPGYNVCYGDYC